MVKAIIEGQKTMTRRVVKIKRLPKPDDKKKLKANTPGLWLIPMNGNPTPTYSIAPYQKNDILWVRETHWVNGGWFSYISENGNYGQEFVEFTDDNAPVLFDKPQDETLAYVKRPAIFMPREAARLFLEVKSVRVERLQDISEEDVKAEGVSVPPLPTCTDPSLKRRCEFASLWDDLCAKRGYGWDSNPWVWVIEFMRVERGGTQ
jgi:hypothetical protein